MIDLQAMQYASNVLSNENYNKEHTDRYSNTKFSNVFDDEIGRYKEETKLYFKGTESTRFDNRKDKGTKQIKFESEREMFRCEENEFVEEASYDFILALEAIGDLLAELETKFADIDEDKLDMVKLETMTLFKSLECFLKEKELNIVAEDIIETYENIDSLISHLGGGLDEAAGREKMTLKDIIIEETFHKLDRARGELQNIGTSIQSDQKVDLTSQIKGPQAITDREISMRQLDKKIKSNNKLLDLEDITMDRAVAEKYADIEEGPVGVANLNTYTLDGTDKTLIEDNSTVLDQALLDLDEKQIFEQIIDKAKLIIDSDKQEIRIKLKPEVLGELILKIESEKGALLAKVMVDNYRTKELIEANLYQFEKETEESGLDIKTFEVFVGNNEDFQKENRQQGYHLSKKPKKLNIKEHEIGKVQPYKEPYNDGAASDLQDIYAEGRLNLFA